MNPARPARRAAPDHFVPAATVGSPSPPPHLVRLRRAWPRWGWTGLFAALCVAVVGYAAVGYAGLDPASARVGLRDPTPAHYPVLVAHIFTGALALTLGPVQVLLGSRLGRVRHRWVGRVYVFAGVVPSALAGVLAAWWSTAGAGATAGFLVGNLAWLLTAGRAYRAARGRRYAEHARWMTYNVALTFSAVTFRIWLPLLLLAQLPILHTVHDGRPEHAMHTAYTISAWLAFLPNVAALMIVQRRRHPGPRTPSSTPVASQGNRTRA